MATLTGIAIVMLLIALVAIPAVSDAVEHHLAPKYAQEKAQAAERHRLAFDADYQTAAFVRGDLATAIYGRFQP